MIKVDIWVFLYYSPLEVGKFLVSLKYLIEQSLVSPFGYIDFLVNHREQSRGFRFQEIQSLTVVNILQKRIKLSLPWKNRNEI